MIIIIIIIIILSLHASQINIFMKQALILALTTGLTSCNTVWFTHYYLCNHLLYNIFWREFLVLIIYLNLQYYSTITIKMLNAVLLYNCIATFKPTILQTQVKK